MHTTIHLEPAFVSQRFTLDAGSQQVYDQRVQDAKRALVQNTWLEPLLSAQTSADFEALQKAIPDTSRYLRFSLLLHDCAMQSWIGEKSATSALWLEIVEHGV